MGVLCFLSVFTIDRLRNAWLEVRTFSPFFPKGKPCLTAISKDNFTQHSGGKSIFMFSFDSLVKGLKVFWTKKIVLKIENIRLFLQPHSTDPAFNESRKVSSAYYEKGWIKPSPHLIHHIPCRGIKLSVSSQLVSKWWRRTWNGGLPNKQTVKIWQQSIGFVCMAWVTFSKIFHYLCLRWGAIISFPKHRWYHASQTLQIITIT